MKIKVERSGGLAAIAISNEIDEKDLPSNMIRKAKKIVADQKSFALPLKSAPLGAADHFTYKISIQDGANERVIVCNQYNIENDLKLLVKYIEKNSRK
jgi:emfourin